MAEWTVKDVAAMAGVSVRTLHHYDEIGLLRPARVGANGYRYYGREELLRLQQILIHRELDIPLGRIAEILDAPDFDRVEALRNQRAALAEKAERYAELVATIDRTIANLNGERTMQQSDLYKGISPEKQAEYEDWLVEKYGDRMKADIAASRKALSSWTKEDHEAAMRDLADIEHALAEGMRRGVAPESDRLAPMLDRHRSWVSAMWGKPCPPEAYAGLADLYLAHPDFVKRYEAIETGFCDFLTTAMKAHAARLEEEETREGTV